MLRFNRRKTNSFNRFAENYKDGDRNALTGTDCDELKHNNTDKAIFNLTMSYLSAFERIYSL